MDKTRLTHSIHQWSLSMSNRNIKTLEYYVKSDLKDAKLLNLASSDEGVPTKHVLSVYRDHVNNVDAAMWNKKVWDDKGNEVNGNKLRLYRCHKPKILVESYVTTMMPFAHRKFLAMLRCGSLPLEIELGRRSKIPLHNRICKLCNTNVEDEVHLLLQCPAYDDLRENIVLYISDVRLSLKDQFCSLLSNTEIQAALGKCVFRIMERRMCLLDFVV